MGEINYAANSDKSKEVRQPKTKVVSSGVKPIPETKMGKLASIFIAEDVSNVRDYVWTSVIVPMCKRGLVELVNTGSSLISNAFSMLVYGTPSARSYGDNYIGSRTNYDKCFGPASTKQNNNQPTTIASKSSPEKDFIFEDRKDAENVLHNMISDVQQYGGVTLADLYDYIGRTPKGNWQMHSVGWTDLSGAYIDPVNGGWKLCMPRLQRLNGG